MKLIFVILSTIMCFYVSAGEKVRYDNYRVYTVTIENEEQLKLMEQIEEMSGDYSFWNDIGLHRDVDIMVAPHKFSDFNDLVNSIKIQSKLKVDNVQKLIDDEQSGDMSRVNNWTSYGTYAQIYAWLDSMITQYPSILTNYNIGYSYQQRLTRAVRLSYKAGNPAIFIEANIHAREWISSATATWFLNNLITSTDPAIRDIAENIDWYIIPIANVDGYVYSHTTNRLWRKTRKPHGIFCIGADPNRNFAFQWMQGGASNNPCSETYAGPNAWSEPETANIRDFILGLGIPIKIYLSFHSYGQYVLLPYGHTTTPSANHANMMSIASDAVTAIYQRYGTVYTYGSTSTTLYIASGVSTDWAYATVGIPVSFTFEMRDKGSNGFILPASQIIPNSLEVTDGILAAILRARILGQI